MLILAFLLIFSFSELSSAPSDPNLWAQEEEIPYGPPVPPCNPKVEEGCYCY